MKDTMKNLIRFLATATLALLLTTGATYAQSHDDHHTDKQDTLAQPELIDGVQVVEIEIGKMGYSAKKIALKAGVPARLIFTRHIEGACPSQVQIPAFGVEKTDLPLEDPVAIEFTPTETGTFTFVCGMGMMKGAVLVHT